jgi:hypothetical protein
MPINTILILNFLCYCEDFLSTFHIDNIFIHLLMSNVIFSMLFFISKTTPRAILGYSQMYLSDEEKGTKAKMIIWGSLCFIGKNSHPQTFKTFKLVTCLTWSFHSSQHPFWCLLTQLSSGRLLELGLGHFTPA